MLQSSHTKEQITMPVKILQGKKAPPTPGRHTSMPLQLPSSLGRGSTSVLRTDHVSDLQTIPLTPGVREAGTGMGDRTPG